MKILILTHRFFPAIGGVETHVYEIAKNLVKDGHKVTIFTSNLESLGSSNKLEKKYSHHYVDGIEVYRFNAYVISAKIDAATIMPGMLWKAFILANKFDIIHVHSYGYFSSLCGTFIKIFSKTPMILTPHFASETVVSRGIRSLYDKILGKFSLRKTNKIIALTDIEKNELKKIADLKEKHFEIIPNGVTLERFKIKYDSNKLRNEYKIKNSDRIILSVCRLAPNKGLKYLLSAAPMILKKYPNTKFVMIGKDWGEKQILIDLAKADGFQDKIIFPGKLSSEKMDSFYLESDIFVLPSIGGEAFGIVLLEAMAAGKPVIATLVGGVPCLVENNKNGFLVPPKDSHALANKIIPLLKNNELRKEIGKNNNEKAKLYSWQSITKKLEAVYQKTKC